MVSSIFKELCHQSTQLVLHFLTPQRYPVPFSYHLQPVRFPPPVLGNHWFIFCLYSFVFTNIPYKRNRTVCLLCLSSFINEIHLRCIHVVAFIIVYSLTANHWVMFQHVDVPGAWSASSFSGWRHLCCFWFLVIVYKPAVMFCGWFLCDLSFYVTWVNRQKWNFWLIW